MKVKELSWREIDPGFRYIGTGHGFTCEVRRVFSGLWEVIGPFVSSDFREFDEAKGYAQENYSKAIKDCIDEQLHE